jgi:hypothetical protein
MIDFLDNTSIVAIVMMIFVFSWQRLFASNRGLEFESSAYLYITTLCFLCSLGANFISIAAIVMVIKRSIFVAVIGLIFFGITWLSTMLSEEDKPVSHENIDDKIIELHRILETAKIDSIVHSKQIKVLEDDLKNLAKRFTQMLQIVEQKIKDN